MEFKRTVAGLIGAAGLALACAPASTHAESSGTTAIIESLHELVDEHPTDALLPLKLAVALDAAGRHEDAQWWRERAYALDPALRQGVLDMAESIPVEDLMARGAGQTTTCFQHGTMPYNGGDDEGDVIVGSMADFQRYGRAASTQDGLFYTAFAFGTTSCNIGTRNLKWIELSPEHPVIGQNMYQWEPWDPGDISKGGRFQQIGMSWLKHGFFALSQNLCCSCTSTNGSALGVGCSDPYGASLNGAFTYLGPRSEVNAATGVFPWPHSSPSENSTLRGRVLVLDADLDQTLPENAASDYVIEGHYVTADESGWGHDNNNASYRRVEVSSSGTTHNIAFISGFGTQREASAIRHWAEVEPGVTYRDVDFSGDGRVTVAYNVNQLDDDTWRYEYLVYNMNSDKCVGEFSVPLPEGVNVENITFHDIHHHSGEPYSRTDWAVTFPNGFIKWATDTFGTDANANAIRWGTTYNFGFDADQPPQDVSTTMKPWKGGLGGNVVITIAGPSPDPCDLLEDLNDDNTVDTGDLGVLISLFGTTCRGGGGCPGDLNGDNTIDTSDLGILLAAFGTSCP